MRLRAGFTLIELIIVAAILAGLMAITFPVYMNAVETAHKVHALSNLRQLCAAMIMYTDSNDGNFPFGFAKNISGRRREESWRLHGLAPAPVAVPSGWSKDGVYDDPDRMEGDSYHWSHSIRPYAKSFDIYDAPGLPTVIWNGIGPTRNSETPARCAFAFNGLLHNYPSALVTNASRVPLVWAGFGKAAIQGFASTNPHILHSRGSTPSDFVYSRHSSLSGQISTLPNLQMEDFNVYSNGIPVGYVDGSAKILNAKKLGLIRDSTGNRLGYRAGFSTGVHSNLSTQARYFIPDPDY